VFVPQGFARRVVACDVLRHDDAVRASDHFPLVVDLLTAKDEAVDTKIPGEAVHEQSPAPPGRA
jgi:hypothetical protein